MGLGKKNIYLTILQVVGNRTSHSNSFYTKNYRVSLGFPVGGANRCTLKYTLMQLDGHTADQNSQGVINICRDYDWSGLSSKDVGSKAGVPDTLC